MEKMRRPLDDLASVTDAAFRNRLSGLQRIASEEAALRQNLAKLDAARHEGHSSARHTMEMRALGADLLWEGWIMRQRIEVNTRLAQLLVQKASLRNDLFRTFGRAQVAAALQAAQNNAERKDRYRSE